MNDSSLIEELEPYGADDQEEEFSWDDVKEGDEETLRERLLPETGEVEGD